eukprot:GFYU01001809.1.p1 GENE.GFYU01001809.1~~GFYU01001809.1.p1  ORF type:complete len:302 (-),score=144.41 GFYU01001809.1:191-1096(-)
MGKKNGAEEEIKFQTEENSKTSEVLAQLKKNMDEEVDERAELIAAKKMTALEERKKQYESKQNKLEEAYKSKLAQRRGAREVQEQKIKKSGAVKSGERTVKGAISKEMQSKKKEELTKQREVDLAKRLIKMTEVDQEVEMEVGLENLEEEGVKSLHHRERMVKKRLSQKLRAGLKLTQEEDDELDNGDEYGAELRRDEAKRKKSMEHRHKAMYRAAVVEKFKEGSLEFASNSTHTKSAAKVPTKEDPKKESTAEKVVKGNETASKLVEETAKKQSEEDQKSKARLDEQTAKREAAEASRVR